MSSPTLPLTLLLAALALASFGCKAFDEGLLEQSDAGGGCVLDKPPTRPEVEGSGGAELVFALRDVFLEQGDEAVDTGYDLDDLCTAEPDFVTECRPPVDEGGVNPDGAGGVDNAFGSEFINFTLVMGTPPQADFRAHQEMGLGVTLVRIRDWDGSPDDNQVDVALLPGAFGTPAVGGAAPELPAPGTLPPPPSWDGNDYFWADESAFVAGEIESPTIRDGNAYVAGGVLVMRPPDRSRLLLTGEGSSLEVVLADATLTGRLSPEGMSEVVLVGRWDLSELTQASRGIGFCPGNTASDRLRRLLDLEADVLLVPGGAGASADCDAMSTAIGFTGYPVRLAGLTQAPAPVSPCE